MTANKKNNILLSNIDLGFKQIFFTIYPCMSHYNDACRNIQVLQLLHTKSDSLLKLFIFNEGAIAIYNWSHFMLQFHVSLQIALLTESIRTDETFVRFFSSVDSHVFHQVNVTAKKLGTEWTPPSLLWILLDKGHWTSCRRKT